MWGVRTGSKHLRWGKRHATTIWKGDPGRGKKRVQARDCAVGKRINSYNSKVPGKFKWSESQNRKHTRAKRELKGIPELTLMFLAGRRLHISQNVGPPPPTKNKTSAKGKFSRAGGRSKGPLHNRRDLTFVLESQKKGKKPDKKRSNIRSDLSMDERKVMLKRKERQTKQESERDDLNAGGKWINDYVHEKRGKD